LSIALIVPTRSRPGNVRRLLESVFETADKCSNVSVYLGVDDDDPFREEIDREAAVFAFFVNIVEIHSEGKFQGVGKLWNLCAKEAPDNILGLIGDDVVFRTKGWDTKVLAEYAPDRCPADNFKLVYGDDGGMHEKISTHPFIHRRYIDITGHYVREEFVTDYIDLWLYQMYFYFNRVTYLPDLVTEHMHPAWGKGEVDWTMIRMQQANRESPCKYSWAEMEPLRVKEAFLIASVIGVQPDFSRIVPFVIERGWVKQKKGVVV